MTLIHHIDIEDIETLEFIFNEPIFVYGEGGEEHIGGFHMPDWIAMLWDTASW